MYKCIHAETGDEIIILHPRWKKRIDDLRALDHAGLLVCQGCRQEVRVKAGEVKRPHFAHKHLQACSFGSESPEILNARAVLYEWLAARYGMAVTVEKQIEGADLPRPIDCWVDTPRGSFGYWIIEAGIKLDPRIKIVNALKALNAPVHPVFLHWMLNEERKELQSLLLSPTERAFFRRTPVDQMLAGVGEVGASIHYLDAESEPPILTTFRALLLHHRPNWYKGLKRSAPLAEVRASPDDGGFLYPGEIAKLGAFREKQARLEQKRKAFAEREAEWGRHLSSRSPEPGKTGGWGVGTPNREDEPQKEEGPEPLTCITCGRVTSDYWSTFFDENDRKMCRCRACLA